MNDGDNEKSVQSCLKIVDRIFSCNGADTSDTIAFRSISHESLCQSFQYWLEKMRPTIDEPINIAVTQSLRDEGIDVLLDFSVSKVKVGFQVKSHNDVSQKDFTRRCIAQISRSHKYSVSRLIIALGADLTDESQREKVRGLISEVSQMGDYCKIFSPEKTLTIWKTFDRKEHPIGQIERFGDAMNLIDALQKKLSSDKYYNHKISWKTTIKKKYNRKNERGNHEFKVVMKQPPDAKNMMDVFKEISLTGESFVIPAENIQKLQIRKKGKLIERNKKVPFIKITPNKRKFLLSLETIDPSNSSPLKFEKLLFTVDSVVGKTIHLSTHESSLPYHFRFSLENQTFIGNIGASIKGLANALQMFKLLKLYVALSSGNDIMFKNASGNIIFSGKARNQPKLLSTDTYETLERLSYIQEKTGQEICPPNRLTAKDLKDMTFAYTLLQAGTAKMDLVEFSTAFNKTQATQFLEIFRDQYPLKDCRLNDMKIEVELFGKKIPLGLGVYEIPLLILSEGLAEVKRQISELKENEICIKFGNAPECSVLVKLYRDN
jgi:hypothetical protein